MLPCQQRVTLRTSGPARTCARAPSISPLAHIAQIAYFIAVIWLSLRGLYGLWLTICCWRIRRRVPLAPIATLRLESLALCGCPRLAIGLPWIVTNTVRVVATGGMW